MIEAVRDELEHAVLEVGLPADSLLIEAGPAVGTILARATELAVDLIVIGTHGRTGVSRLVLGSVAEGVVRDAPCNVLVVRLNASEQALDRAHG
jgi:nucleotide-binding universal stress UspA family protein